MKGESEGAYLDDHAAAVLENGALCSPTHGWSPVRKFLPVLCRTGSAHTAEDPRKVLLALEPAGHRHIQHAHLSGTQHLLGALYPAVQHKLVRALAR
jgi:hypothetical protein